MGFTINFSYCPKKDKSYDMENQKTFSRKVGCEDEDSSLEEVVKVIKSELARRDILVVHTEIYEYTKKKIKFKEIKGGIIIKDQKFLFNDSSVNDMVSVKAVDSGVGETSEVKESEQPPKLVNLAVPPQPQVRNLRPLRYEKFDVTPMHAAKMPKSFKFTVGKSYPIYRELTKGSFPLQYTNYVTIDHRNVEVEVSSEYFIAPALKEVEDFSRDPIESELNSKLSHRDDYLDLPIPNLRS
jgi:hypothetical protein